MGRKSQEAMMGFSYEQRVKNAMPYAARIVWQIRRRLKTLKKVNMLKRNKRCEGSLRHKETKRRRKKWV